MRILFLTDNFPPEVNAPAPAEIFAYARRLGLSWAPQPLKECGYRKMAAGGIELLADVGGIVASYQPGHSHADALNYELRINGLPFVVDTGISTYDKTPRRQYERSTAAHNTVTPTDSRDSAEVWGGFRVGRRPQVVIDTETPGFISAHHDGFGRKVVHKRTFALNSDGFRIADSLPAGVEGVSRVHLATDIEITAATDFEIQTSVFSHITVSGADRIQVKEVSTSKDYNNLRTSKVLEIYFVGQVEYAIKM